MSQDNYPKARKVGFVIATFFLSLMIVGLGGELMTRLAWRGHPAMATDERSSCFRYDAELGWSPVANSTNHFQHVRSITAHHNAEGFRDKPRGPKVKNRIAFVGDSFVWGYDAEEAERFTDKLEALLPGWEMINLGVNGYGTDQEWILIQKWFDHYQPDIVVLVFCNNDTTDNTAHVTPGGYYKPYFEVVDGQLVRRGIPVSKSMPYYRLESPWLFKSRLVEMLVSRYVDWKSPQPRSAVNPTGTLVGAMKAYVAAKGAKFVLAYVSDDDMAQKRSLCESQKIDYLFLLEFFFQTEDCVYEKGKGNWTPKGHDYVCSMLYQFLVGKHYVPEGPTEAVLDAALFHRRRVEDAMAQCQRALEIHPDNVEAHNILGRVLFEAGQLDEAIQHYERALQLKPHDAPAHFNLGNVLITQGKWTGAIEHFERALQLKPDDAEAHHKLGKVWTTQGRPNEAIEHYKRTLQLKPDDADAHNDLGNALAEQGKWNEAMEHYERTLQLKPDDAQAHYNLGNALAAQGKLTEAIQHYQQLLQLKLDDAGVHCNLGYALAARGKWTEAIQHFERALQLNPDFAEAHYNLGNVLATQGKLTEAIEHFERALQLNPVAPDTHCNLGYALATQGKWTEAIQHFERALLFKPDYAEAHYNWGNALAMQGKLTEAIQHFQQALNLATAQANPALAESIRAQLKFYQPALPQPKN